MKAVAISLLVVVVGMAVIGALLLRDSGSRFATSLKQWTSGGSSEVRAPGVDSDPGVTRDPDGSSGGSDVTSQPAHGVEAEIPALRGRGSIALKVVDATTSEPIADLPFVIYSERPSRHVLARGVTDEHGESTIDELPEDTVILETPRRPPHANTVFATWLKDAQHQQVVMRVGRGGTVRGRVVDDLRAPLAGVEVRADGRPGPWPIRHGVAAREPPPEVAARFASSSEVLATTDASGHFEVGALLERPTSIWIDHGAMSPRKSEPVQLTFWLPPSRGGQEASPHEGDVIELPDLVLERCRVFAGRVLASDGRPAPGCIVTTRHERHFRLEFRAFEQPLFDAHGFNTTESPEGDRFRFDVAPWEEGFIATAGEAITASDGSFEVIVPAWNMGAFVAAPDGAKGFFTFPRAKPGERVDGIEYRFPAQTQLWFELTDSDGEPLPAKDRDGGSFWVAGGAVLKDGREVGIRFARASPTRFGAITDASPQEIARLVVQAPHFETATWECTSPPIDRPTIALSLRRTDSFELAFHFRFADVIQREALDGVTLRLLARADPAAASAAAKLKPAAERHFEPNEQPSISLFVPTRREWIVSIVGPFGADGRGDGEVELGRFVPDGTTHEVELPSVSLAWLAKRAHGAIAKTNATARKPEGRCEFELVDAESAEPVDGRHVEIARADGSSAGAEVWDVDTREREGRSILVLHASPGSYTVVLRKRGWRDSEAVSITIAADETQDGGRVALRSLAPHRLRLRQSDGSAAAWWSVEAIDPALSLAQLRAFHGFEFGTSGDGLATIRGELPESFLLVAFPPGSEYGGSDGWMPVRFAATPWPATETRELTLPPMRALSVVIDLNAIEPELRGGALDVAMRVAEGSLVETSYWCKAGNCASAPPGCRRYLFMAPADRYLVRARGGFFAAIERDAEIVDSDRLQEITLVAQPK